jgi:hypothetical protein
MSKKMQDSDDSTGGRGGKKAGEGGSGKRVKGEAARWNSRGFGENY